MVLDGQGLTVLDMLGGWGVARHDIGIDGRVLVSRLLIIVGVAVKKMGAETPLSYIDKPPEGGGGKRP